MKTMLHGPVPVFAIRFASVRSLILVERKDDFEQGTAELQLTLRSQQAGANEVQARLQSQRSQ
jgi:hypothetical protein